MTEQYPVCDVCLITIPPNNPYAKLHPMKPNEVVLCYDCYIQWQLNGRQPLEPKGNSS